MIGLFVIGHWSLVIGHSSLVIGHWSLVIRHSSFVIRLCKGLRIIEKPFNPG
ncbi:hypothetical protein [Coleofasciculus sp. F4-SAH-05]|uniref:hypothetical protein n=1 Tax=Coleofasciculus sp. F4-SAH-05 TaxID=3069525 RepID=UPI00330198E1